jgi:FeS assembly protein IscX
MHESTMHWLDVELIAESLADLYPDHDPVTVSFPTLRDLVITLPGFKAQPDHPCNERILEAIQQAWLDELAD